MSGWVGGGRGAGPVRRSVCVCVCVCVCVRARARVCVARGDWSVAAPVTAARALCSGWHDNILFVYPNLAISLSRVV